jgi:hypothetical protein
MARNPVNPTHSINCHTPLFSSSNVVPVSRILVIYGIARTLSSLGCKTAAKRGQTRSDRHPMYEGIFEVKMILQKP